MSHIARRSCTLSFPTLVSQQIWLLHSSPAAWADSLEVSAADTLSTTFQASIHVLCLCPALASLLPESGKRDDGVVSKCPLIHVPRAGHYVVAGSICLLSTALATLVVCSGAWQLAATFGACRARHVPTVQHKSLHKSCSASAADTDTASDTVGAF